jgi:NAD(P)H-hydrate epimerase
MKPILVTKKLIQLPLRKNNSSKGDNGRVFILGGSKEYIGAPALAGIAALRSGADSVVIAAPEKTAWAINCLSADLVTKKLKGEYLCPAHYPDIVRSFNKIDCLLAGPGIFEKASSLRLLKKVLHAFQGPKILDAGALCAFDEKKLQNAILLPNAKEYKLLNASCTLQYLIQHGNVIVQKGATSRIMAHNKHYYNKTGNAGLTKAGTGDVLAGLCAGFVAQSHDLLQSALNASYLLGKNADLLHKKCGFSYTASDLACQFSSSKNFLISAGSYK